ncbi:flagellar hook protein FlgE [Massilia arenosa]|uniref:Flagellar hook protein FlgE n=1 Tax=Zemynaea arenosa TaxID=2561931 RepID=A0A4Y9SXG8_9BURK|nr:flagellar hook protein FlgE [Massilia arenosa]TFW29914.1 flagellar hook protein FlgE [Massilia arenosa]
MSFQQGLSGLNGAAKSLDVIGNNIANASTVGFKGSQAQFADVYANSLNGAGGNTAGIGTKVSQIAQMFTQGNIESSNNPLDIAINGAGFFRTVVSGAVQYSRNGQFSLDKEGYLVNAQGAKLTGFQANDHGVLLAGAPIPIQINTQDLSPVATKHVDTQINLDSGSEIPKTTPFNENDPTSYNKQTPVDVYDTLGNPHVMSMYYVKTGAGTWNVYAATDGVEITNHAVAQASDLDSTAVASKQAWLDTLALVPRDPAAEAAAIAQYAADAGAAVAAAAGLAGATAGEVAAITAAATSAGTTTGITAAEVDKLIAGSVHVPAVPVGHLNFDGNGALSTALMSPQTLPLTVNLPIYPATGSAPTLSVELNFSGTTQYGAATSEKKTTQDGYTAGHLQRFAAGSDGIILGQYSNGQSQPLGQIVLANFANPNGLSPLGNNAWAETSMSGQPTVGTPNSGSLGVLQSSAVENSNVDLTAELVSMITAQRVYQANAQTIKTQDSVLQTLVNLR